MEHKFGGYRFDAVTGRLWAGDRELHLTPKAAAVLDMLLAVYFMASSS